MMPSESQLISEIESIVVTCPSWTIGMTDDPDRRRRGHGNPVRWQQWYAVTETSARKVEDYFLGKGMRGAPGGGISPNSDVWT